MSRYEELFPYWPEGRELLSRIVDAIAEPAEIGILPPVGGSDVRFFLGSTKAQNLAQGMDRYQRAAFDSCVSRAQGDLHRFCKDEVSETIRIVQRKVTPKRYDFAVNSMMRRLSSEHGAPVFKALLRKQLGLEE